MDVERSETIEEYLEWIRLTHVKDDRDLWNRVRRHQLQPYHRYFYDDQTDGWCRFDGKPVQYEEVYEWVQRQKEKRRADQRGG